MVEETASKGERSRQVILEAAYDLFLKQGYAATSMRQIAGHAGLALGGIYNHFGGKEAIFKALIIERHPYRQVMPIILKTPADDPETFVRTASRAMVDELGRRPDFIKLMMIELVEFNGRNMPGVVEQVMVQVLPLIQKFRGHKGGLRKMHPFIFFRAFIGLFFSYYITEMMIAGTPIALTQKNSLDEFVEIFLHGILAGKEPA